MEYTEPGVDTKVNGLVHNHVLFIPAGSDYDEGLEDFHEAMQALLCDAIEDLTLAQSVDMRVLSAGLLDGADTDGDGEYAD